MKQAFISYSHEDRALVARLAYDLEQRQVEAWMDRKLAPGERYKDKILAQIARADHVIVVLSEHARTSRWVAFETGAALVRETEDGTSVHVLRLDNSDLPDYLADRHVVSIEEASYTDGLADLCRALSVPERVDYKLSAGRSERPLKVFQAGPQWMELLAHGKGLDCVLVDGGEQRAHMQWTLASEVVRESLRRDRVHVRPPRHEQRPWGTFDIGPRRSWRWSPFLFGDTSDEAVECFKEALHELLDTV